MEILKMLLGVQEDRLKDLKEFKLKNPEFIGFENVQIRECELHIGLTKIAIENYEKR